jgi:predicted molibdopterin-dependent oxidoreductase YjgC
MDDQGQHGEQPDQTWAHCRFEAQRAAPGAEKEGTMTSSERRVGLVRRALARPGEARPDWEIVATLEASQ